MESRSLEPDKNQIWKINFQIAKINFQIAKINFQIAKINHFQKMSPRRRRCGDSAAAPWQRRGAAVAPPVDPNISTCS